MQSIVVSRSMLACTTSVDLMDVPGSKKQHPQNTQLLRPGQLEFQDHWDPHYQYADVDEDVPVYDGKPHRYSADTLISVEWLNEGGGRPICKKARKCV